MRKRFFSYSPDMGIVKHTTAEEAEKSAGEQIRQYREDAKFDGEWAMEVQEVFWGEIKGAAVEEKHEEDTCDFKLQSL